MVCVTAGSDLQSFSGDCLARGWWDFQIPWVYDDAYGPHRMLKAFAAGAVRDMQHDSNSAAGACEFGGAKRPRE